jgi:anthranilate phosphoribosyltransferase
MSVTPYLRKLLEQRAPLTRVEAASLLNLILTGQASDAEIAAVLGALAARGETAEELAGFADATRAAATPFPLDEAERSQLVDTCGTGGDGADTFNISTAAALVAAAAGAKVAKHGNRAVTSKSGSADVLEALGIPIDLSPEAAADSIRTHGFAYLHAPAMHSSVKAVAPVRRALGVRTVFNVVGPLTNPAGAKAQVMGVYAAERVTLVAEAMLLLGTRHAFVVHGFTDSTQTRGMDELSISGPSLVAELRDGRITYSTITPEELGLERASIAMLRGGDASANAAILQAIFAGKPGPARDVVVLNAAAVLVTANRAADLADGIRLAQRTIDSGAVLVLIEALSNRAERL